MRSRFTKIFLRMLISAALLTLSLNAAFLAVRYIGGDASFTMGEGVGPYIRHWIAAPIVNSAFIATWAVVYFPRRYLLLSVPAAALIFMLVNHSIAATPLFFYETADLCDLLGVTLLAYMVIGAASMWDDADFVPKFSTRSEIWK